MFLHIGLIHLAFNMAALLVVGGLTERMLGMWRFSSCTWAPDEKAELENAVATKLSRRSIIAPPDQLVSSA